MNVIPFTLPTLSREEKKEVLDTLDSGWLTSGPKVARFERLLSGYLGCAYVRAVNSCTSALHAAVLACGVQAGDEVITTAFTFCATVNAIIHAGATPVFADIDPNSYTIDPADIERKITRRTKAILIVDYAGCACDMDRIMRIAKKHGLKVIEDAAHAMGGEYKGRKIGTLADVTCFSFHAAKNMTTGEGGAIATRDPAAIRFIEKAWFFGIDRPPWQRHAKGAWKYRVCYPGFKYNLNDILASIGIHQLKKLPGFLRARRRIASAYDRAFRGNTCLRTQTVSYRLLHTHHLYPIVLERSRMRISRDAFIRALQADGIQTSVHFIPLYKHPAYRAYLSGSAARSLPVTETVYKGALSLPIYPRLSLHNVRRIIGAVTSLLRTHAR